MSTLKIFNANAKKTGSAIKMDVVLPTDANEGHIECVLAMQTCSTGTEPQFDWENPIKFNLFLDDISEIIQVMRGMTESVRDGKGLYHRSSDGATLIKFSHFIDPIPGYLLSVSTKANDGEQRNINIFFDPSKTLILMLAIEGVVHKLAFGI